MRSPADFHQEHRLWKQGFKQVAGIDEVGRGAWAGPMVAAAVVFPPFFDTPFELFDSKLLLPKQREMISEKIKEVAAIGIGLVDVTTINNFGIRQATQKTFKKAIKALKLQTDYYLIDAFYIQGWKKDKQLPIKRGDQTCASIAAASIIAKVYRDNLMKNLGNKYSEYGFGQHKGYGTRIHQEAIAKYKFSDIHRTSFNIARYLNGR
ncbi:MAG: ribonuclease HII [Candidatus Woykebacteria bacterium RBG_16_43_9]|uniref:Ribonuclease n=1 Tax=Candidatus Woykebacteria bacterium RBG_16_43_9 TaxID=1802596 RepID=A0A1G1WGL6_9BACT|nr:MAG: ribonuclease HII [Candidatus Woykebacteria bacterium RBG_16_43_9]